MPSVSEFKNPGHPVAAWLVSTLAAHGGRFGEGSMLQTRIQANQFINDSKKLLPALQKKAKQFQSRVSKLPSVDALQIQIREARDAHHATVDELKALKEETGGNPPPSIVKEELGSRNFLKAKKESLRKTESIRELNKVKKQINDIKTDLPFAKQYLAQTDKFVASGKNSKKKKPGKRKKKKK